MINYELAALIAVLAFTYTNVLTKPDMPFNKTYNKLWKYFKNDDRQKNGKGLHPLFMLFIHCEKCIAGQIALWVFLYQYAAGYIFYPLETFGHHVLFTAFAIFVADILQKTYNKIYNQ